jgi:hypothetical protein
MTVITIKMAMHSATTRRVAPFHLHAALALRWIRIRFAIHHDFIGVIIGHDKNVPTNQWSRHICPFRIFVRAQPYDTSRLPFRML